MLKPKGYERFDQDLSFVTFDAFTLLSISCVSRSTMDSHKSVSHEHQRQIIQASETGEHGEVWQQIYKHVYPFL